MSTNDERISELRARLRGLEDAALVSSLASERADVERRFAAALDAGDVETLVQLLPRRDALVLVDEREVERLRASRAAEVGALEEELRRRTATQDYERRDADNRYERQRVTLLAEIASAR